MARTKVSIYFSVPSSLFFIDAACRRRRLLPLFSPSSSTCLVISQKKKFFVSFFSFTALKHFFHVLKLSRTFKWLRFASNNTRRRRRRLGTLLIFSFFGNSSKPPVSQLEERLPVSNSPPRPPGRLPPLVINAYNINALKK